MNTKARKLLSKALMVSVISGFAMTATLPTTAQAFPGMAQENAQKPAQQPSQGNAQAISGRVVETMNSGGYTYVNVQNGENKVWVAVPQTEVQVGQQVVIDGAMVMQNFTSSTLNHTFDSIVFGRNLSVKK